MRLNIIILFLLFFSIAACQETERMPLPPENEPAQINADLKAHYVGRASCKHCHEKQYALYTGSDHDMAMDIATDNTVLGDFNNASFTHHGVTSKFYRRDGKFFVFTEGLKGEFHEFEIKYVFGYSPLQQYLIEFPRGSYQMLPLCWDTRHAKEGGQRWFHIYGDERIKAGDILYWTQNSQNWNYMCAECHSTNLKKNYDYKTETYNTTWSEIDVSCEACHGPGSRHVEWAEAQEKGRKTETHQNKGLVIRLKDDNKVEWVFNKETGNAKLTKPRQSNTQLEMCARCHSRRGVISEDYYHGKSLLNTHRLSLLEEQLYYPDGQIFEEVYVYASFLQSKMYQAGIVCTDCHDPHSTRRYEKGDAICNRCHSADKFESPSHHFHKIESKGSGCVACHMIERKYMVVDPRHDHSFRVPRPDLSVKLGTPNTCNNCHRSKSTEWAAEYLKKWYGKPDKGKKHYGETFWAGRKSYPYAQTELIRIAGDKNNPAIVRATALSLLRNYPNLNTIVALKKTLKDPNPLIREAAVRSIDILPPDNWTPLIIPLLKDPIRLVRTSVSRHLVSASSKTFTEDDLKVLKDSIEEYKQTQYINADNPAALMNLGVLYLEQGDYEKAESFYKKTIEIEPAFMISYINLADLYRIQKKEDRGKEVLLRALKIDPDAADVHYALGLLLIRTGKHDQPIKHLERAAKLEQENARYSYVYAIALHSAGKPALAISVLEGALKLNPYDRNLLYSLAAIHRDRGEIKKALSYAVKLTDHYPEDQNFRQLEQQLRSLTEKQK